MFQGFSGKIPDFFWELRFNNEKAWFQEHKEAYQRDVQQPFRALADELFDWFQEKYPQQHMSLHVSRIYRDARRLFGRGPFKDHLWFSFQSGDQWTNVPCFYVEIGAECWGYGMGCWTGEAGFSQRFRRYIDRDPSAAEKLLRRLEARPEFRLQGERYAKSKGHAGEPIEAWYNMKGWSISADCAYDEASASPEVVGKIKNAFEFLMPYYEMMNQVYHSAD